MTVIAVFTGRCLQLIPWLISLLLALTEIRHSHNLDHQTRPARKMLRALPFTRLGVILFPRKARLLPTLIHSIDQVIAKFGVDFSCASTMGTRLSRDVLEISIVSKDETA
jgi:hypothetical protein